MDTDEVQLSRLLTVAPLSCLHCVSDVILVTLREHRLAYLEELAGLYDIDAAEMQEWLAGADTVMDRIEAYEDALSSPELRQGEPWKKRGMYWDRDEFRDDDD